MTSAFWQHHPGTPQQTRLLFSKCGKRSRPTQADVIIELLRQKRSQGKPLELYEIMAAGIAQHGARLKEIRNQGFIVRNELERSADGRVLSRYWLELDPERDAGQP